MKYLTQEKTTAALIGGIITTAVLYLTLFSSTLVMAFSPELSDAVDSSSTANQQNIISDPQPALPGAFCSCLVDLSEPGPYYDKNYGSFYFPRKRDDGDKKQCLKEHNTCHQIRGGPYYLAVIHHANGAKFTEYDELARHLASHGFAVVSFRTNSDVKEAAAGLNYLYEQIGAALSHQVALIGHSQGGYLTLSEGHYITEAPVNKQLAAIVLMAPKVIANETYLLDSVTSGLLGLHWTRDNDSATYGHFIPPARSVFKAFDNAGIIEDSADQHSLTKDFVFFDKGGHENQNKLWIIAYVTAFLHRHLAGREIYDRFLKYQEVPAGLPPETHPVSQQHIDPQGLVIANFESGSLTPQLYNNALEIGLGALVWPTDWSWALDSQSPHDTKVLKFQVMSPSDGSAVEFPFTSAQSLSDYRHLSFRITQVYDSVNLSSGTTRSFVVQLCALEQCWAVDLMDYGGIPFPIVVKNLTLAQTWDVIPDATKNAMRSILIRLQDFGIPAGTQIDRLRFDFSDGNAEGASFIVDDLAFYH